MTAHLWLIAGLVIGLVELIVPGQLFLGVAIATVLMGLAILLGLWHGGLAGALVVTALLSGAVMLLLRRIMGVREGQVRIVHRDINET